MRKKVWKKNVQKKISKKKLCEIFFKKIVQIFLQKKSPNLTPNNFFSKFGDFFLYEMSQI